MKAIWKLLNTEFSDDIHDALHQQHHAAQFIALAGRHLLTHQPDDSNTNMQYLPEKGILLGNKLSDGFSIALLLTDLALQVTDNLNNSVGMVSLPGKTKQQIFTELKTVLLDAGTDVSAFTADLHYELPAHALDSGSTFYIKDELFLEENARYRNNAEIILNEIAAVHEDAESVRVWPHHFDTGSFIPLKYNKENKLTASFGIGWAIPDSMVNEPYYYLSFWSENTIIDFSSLPAPEAGNWITTGWKGGILKQSEIIMKDTPVEQHQYVKSFFTSGIEILKSE